MNLDFCYVHVSCIYNVMEVIVTSVCLNSHMVSVGLILVSTSCMQDSSQPVFVVADHISHSSLSQWFHCHHDCFL